METILHESDYATTITLDNETFALIGNSNTEDAIVMQVGVNTAEYDELPVDATLDARVDNNK